MNFYIQLANCLSEAENTRTNLKNVIFNNFKGDKVQSAYGVLLKAQKCYQKTQSIANKINQLEKQKSITNADLFTILCVQNFLSQKKRIIGGGKLQKLIKLHQNLIQQELKEFIELYDQENEQTDQNGGENQFQADLIKKQIFFRFFQNNRSTKIETEQNELIEELKNQFDMKQNQIIPNLYTLQYANYQLALKEKQNLIDNQIFTIQNFSSSLPAFLLFKNIIKEIDQYEFDAIDACAAPGNQTLQIADYLNGVGTLYAFERDDKRFKVLQKRVDERQDFLKTEINCQNNDFLKVDPFDDDYENVQLILLDPSCSGSGMLNEIYRQHKFGIEKELEEEQKEEESTHVSHSFYETAMHTFSNLSPEEKMKVENLSSFQIQLLNHAALFPAVQRISYSTCSIFHLENEVVVKKFLNSNPDFELAHSLKKWKTRGFTEIFHEAYKCVRVNPLQKSEIQSDGFFIAIFQRKL